MERKITPLQKEELDDLVLTKLLRLNGVIFGLVCGIILGLMILIATLWLVVKGGPVVGPNLSLLGEFFIGYQVTILGSFIGLGYGFVIGYIIGFSVAYLYNWIVDLRVIHRKH